MLSNNDKFHYFGFDQITSKNSHRQKDTDKMFYLPKITVRHDGIQNVSKFAGLTDLSSIASNSRVTSRKLSMKPPDVYAENQLNYPLDFGLKPELAQGSESERVAMERRHSSPYRQDYETKYLQSLECYGANYGRKIHLKQRDRTLKTDHSISTTESSVQVPDRTKSQFSKIESGLNPLKVKYPGQNMSDFLSINDSLNVKKPAYNILKPKHCINEPIEKSNNEMSVHLPKEDMGHEELNEDISNLKMKSSSLIPPPKDRLGRIGIHTIKREAYSSKKRTKNFRATSVLESDRFVKSPRTKENSNFESVGRNTERRNDTILTSRQEDENIQTDGKIYSEFEHLFKLMKEKVISEYHFVTGCILIISRKKNKYFSVEFSQSKRRFRPVKIVPKIQKPYHQTYGHSHELSSFEASQEMDISKIKIYPSKEAQALVHPIAEAKKSTEEVFVPMTCNTSSEKIKPPTDRNILIPIKDEEEKSNESAFTGSSQYVVFEGAEPKENKISKLLYEPRRKSSSPPKKKFIGKEVNEQTYRVYDEHGHLAPVGKEASMKALEKQLLMQQGKRDSVHGWSDKEIIYESVL